MGVLDLAGVGEGEDFVPYEALDGFADELWFSLGSEGGLDEILQFCTGRRTIFRGGVPQLSDQMGKPLVR